MASSILPILTIALQAEPELVALVQSVMALKKKYPTLTADQIASIVQSAASQADAEFDSVLSKIAADQAQSGQAPPPPPK